VRGRGLAAPFYSIFIEDAQFFKLLLIAIRPPPERRAARKAIGAGDGNGAARTCRKLYARRKRCMIVRKANRPGRLAGKLVPAVLAALFWFEQAAYAAGLFVQNGSNGQGGYQTGGYDALSPQPAAYLLPRLFSLS